MAQFEQALKRLVEDVKYREDVMKDPKRLTKDYKKLAANEMLLLMQVWLAGGHRDAAMSIIRLCHCCCSRTK